MKFNKSPGSPPALLPQVSAAARHRGLGPLIQKPKDPTETEHFIFRSKASSDIQSIPCSGRWGLPVSPNSVSVQPGEVPIPADSTRGRAGGEARPPRGEPRAGLENGGKIPRWTWTRSTALWMFGCLERSPAGLSLSAPARQPRRPRAAAAISIAFVPERRRRLGIGPGGGAGKETPADPRFSFLKIS